MPNSFFRFKQFTIHQDKCAMKVCTDSCLFGSLTSTLSKGEGVIRVLDIGTGTGLLTLMYAQKNANAIIDAVEIDASAAHQAKENFAASPWKERLTIYQGPIQQFNLSTPKAYDLIISNPPFFENDLKANNIRKNMALHNETLSLEELSIAIKNNLSDNGTCTVLLPHNRSLYFEQLMNNNQFHLNQKILIKQTPIHNYFRNILTFSKQKVELIIIDIVIQDTDHNYTPIFTTLLKDYYLNL